MEEKFETRALKVEEEWKNPFTFSLLAQTFRDEEKPKYLRFFLLLLVQLLFVHFRGMLFFMSWGDSFYKYVCPSLGLSWSHRWTTTTKREPVSRAIAIKRYCTEQMCTSLCERAMNTINKGWIVQNGVEYMAFVCMYFSVCRKMKIKKMEICRMLIWWFR